MSVLEDMDEGMRDAFLEIANIGIGRSASAMSDLANKHVRISIPRIDFVRTGEEQSFALVDGQSTVLVEQRFHGDLNGTAILCLATSGAMRLAGLLLGEEVRQDAFGEIEQGALLELGNIMIGGLIGNVSNVLGLSIGYDLPEMQLNGSGKMLTLLGQSGHCMVIVNSNLAIETNDVSSYLILALGEDDFRSMIDRIRKLL